MGRKTVIKKEQELLKNLQWAEILTRKDVKVVKISKRRSSSELLEKFPIINEYCSRWVRPIENWKSRSYNENKQLNDLLTYLFCKYKVPKFMYDVFTKKYSPTFSTLLQNWFISIGNGASFRKISKDVFTAQEAHWFLNAPSDNNAHQNAWWAKCTVAGWKKEFIKPFISRVNNFHFFDKAQNTSTENIINFFAKYMDDLDKDTLLELLDYLLAQPSTFSLEGRTLSSVIRLSNEWHAGRFTYKDVKYGNTSWPGISIANWSHREGNINWEIIQLVTAKDLAYESKVQRHCVGGYVHYCVRGSAFIFTVHSTVINNDNYVTRKHVTIEINSLRQIVQVKGKFNRHPDADETRIVNLWAASNGVRWR